MKKLGKLFYSTYTCMAPRSKVIRSSQYPGLIFYKHMHMQIFYKPVVKACDDFEILMHTSKREQVSLKFPFIQFRLVRWNWVQHS